MTTRSAIIAGCDRPPEPFNAALRHIRAGKPDVIAAAAVGLWPEDLAEAIRLARGGDPVWDEWGRYYVQARAERAGVLVDVMWASAREGHWGAFERLFRVCEPEMASVSEGSTAAGGSGGVSLNINLVQPVVAEVAGHFEEPSSSGVVLEGVRLPSGDGVVEGQREEDVASGGGLDVES